MDRVKARELWLRIASGELEHHPDEYDQDDLHGWIRQVARAVLDADKTGNAKRRPYDVTAAVGLGNKGDGYAALRKIVSDPMWEFPTVTPDGEMIDVAQTETVRLIVSRARDEGVLTGVYLYDDKKARELVRNIWTKKI